MSTNADDSFFVVIRKERDRIRAKGDTFGKYANFIVLVLPHFFDVPLGTGIFDEEVFSLEYCVFPTFDARIAELMKEHGVRASNSY